MLSYPQTSVQQFHTFSRAFTMTPHITCPQTRNNFCTNCICINPLGPANKSYRMEAKISASPPAPIYLERGHAVVGGHLFSPFPQKRVLGDSLMQESSILLPCDRDAQIGSPAIRKVKDVESNPTLTVSQHPRLCQFSWRWWLSFR